MHNDPVFRRPKRSADEDARYSLRVGLVIFAFLMVTLPFVMG